MRCVSYTRSVSGCWAITPSNRVITEQNNQIAEFAKKKNWKITERYSDRKKDVNEESAFLKLKEDGINRKFDCVVFSSILYAGKNISSAKDLLGQIFYPAGIIFAIAEDDFCSADKTRDEVESYLQACKGRYHGEMASQVLVRHSSDKMYRKYGYLWVADTTLEINPETASVIKEIFSLCCQGYSFKRIAKHLNEHGIDSPFQYEGRKTGRENKINRDGWNGSTVKNILARELYIGKWKRCIQGMHYEYECPAIIDEETFEEARKQIQLRNNAKRERKKTCVSWFTKRTYDKDTGHPVIISNNLADGTMVLRFRYPAPEHSYDKSWISEEMLSTLAREEVRKEFRAAQKVYQLLEAGEGVVEREARKENLRKDALRIMEIMAGNEAEFMKHSRFYENGESDESAYMELKNEHLQNQKTLDEELQEIVDKMKMIDVTYSLENPWLIRFRNIDIEQFFNTKTVGKYIKSVQIYRFEKVELEFYLSEWKDNFPKEWLSDTEE